MEYRTLGRTGLRVSTIGLGTEHLERTKGTADAVLGAAVDAGVSYVDLLFVDSSGEGAEWWDACGPALRAHRDRLVLALHWGPAVDYDLAYCRRSFDDDLHALYCCSSTGSRAASAPSAWAPIALPWPSGWWRAASSTFSCTT